MPSNLATSHHPIKHDELTLASQAVIVCTMMCVAAGADGYQISLNGNIIANLGFVRRIGRPNAAGVYALDPDHTAIWGAMQSLGQLIAMVFVNPLSDTFGRKYTLYFLWLVLLGVNPHSLIVDCMAMPQRR